MVDFRYHALSLVAVFLALGIGIVLGVTIGDSLVSDADRNLRDSLRGDLTEAREDVRSEQERGARRDEVIEETAPEVAAGRLRGRRIAFVALGERPGEVAEAVEDAVELGGGDLTRSAVLEAPEGGAERRLARRGRRIGRLIERGGRAARALRRRDPRRFSGSYRKPVDAVIVYRDPPDEAEDDDEARALELREAFETGLFEGFRDNVVGVEVLGTDPSQAGWYEDQVVASVDNIDVAAGRLALVLLLEEASVADITEERPEGRFGYKDGADRALPDLSD